MIIVTLNEKGGAGKSTTANHFASAYLMERNDGPIHLYEFDAHNNSSRDVENDPRLTIKTVRGDEESMEQAIAEIEFLSDEEDVIVDIGGSHNSDNFLKLISRSSIADTMIFVVPELNKMPESSESTVEKIENIVESPKIILALNNFDGESGEKKESFYKFLYGSEAFGLKPAKKLLENKNVKITTLPRAEFSLGVAYMSRTSLWDLSRVAIAFKDLSPAEKKKAWGKNGKSCDKDTYVERNRQLNVSIKALATLEQAKDFFDALDAYMPKG